MRMRRLLSGADGAVLHCLGGLADLSGVRCRAMGLDIVQGGSLVVERAMAE